MQLRYLLTGLWLCLIWQIPLGILVIERWHALADAGRESARITHLTLACARTENIVVFCVEYWEAVEKRAGALIRRDAVLPFFCTQKAGSSARQDEYDSHVE